MREEGTAEGTEGTPPARHLRRLRVRSLLLLVVLIPTLGLVIVAGTSAARIWTQRTAAVDLQAEADALAAIVDARATAARESTQSAVITVAGDLGVGIDQLSDLYDVDYRAELASARAGVDADTTLQALPGLEQAILALDGLRSSLDAGTATFEDSRTVFDALLGTIDAVWRDRFERIDRRVTSASLPGSVHARLDEVESTFDVLSSGDQRAQLSIQLLQVGPDAEQTAELVSAQSRFDTAIEDLSRTGDQTSTALAMLQEDPASRRFDATLRDAASDLVAGRVSPLASDPLAFGDAFVDGAPWSAHLTDLVQAAAADLREEAATRADAATRDLWTQVGIAGALTVLALVSALVLAGSVTRPIRRLEGAAHQIHEGRFALEPLEAGGPRELADTASAFNEMAFTLAAVEAHAVALADDPDAPVLNSQLPGRTGRALQVALNRLRSSIRRAEQQRRELEQAATHDGLTGLLNRRAAFAMIEHDLSRALREDRRMMALFIDLDGLKEINDAYGHAAGDDALRLTAEALRGNTRQSDVVARLGGDEFLVAGIVLEDPPEVQLLADRIREAVASQELACPERRVPLRCSIGVALTTDADDTVDSLVRKADGALYTAKREGRDRVAWHDPSSAGR
jgi:diguanylate cyclase (GGDEF)-like protein